MEKVKDDDYDEEWKGFVLGNRDDQENPQKRNNKNLLSQIEFDDRFEKSSIFSDGSDEEDLSKTQKFMHRVVNYVYWEIESWTKLFSYILHTKLLLK